MKPVLMLLCWSALAFNVALAEVSTPAASAFQNAASLNELLQMVKQQRLQRLKVQLLSSLQNQLMIIIH